MQSGYELLKRLAAGGMGEVFVARRVGAGNFEKRVALKLMLPHLASNDELVRRFHAEARLAARMHHPNIVEIFDVGEAEGRPFIAMQLVEGVTLSRVMRAVTQAGEWVPLPIVRLVATGLCEALAYAHGLRDGRGRPLGVVHRDVTPSNVLVSRAGAVLLTDFGIARVRDDSKTEAGAVLGKAAYLPPEQLRGDRRIDARADVYSAALTLYVLLTGANPFKRGSTREEFLAVEAGIVPPAHEVRTDVPRGMSAALQKALAREPDARFQSATALREALLDGPVATAPELAAWVQRHCAQDFAGIAVEADDGPGTRSLLTVTPTQLPVSEADVTAPQPLSSEVLAPRRWRRAGAVLVVAVAGAGGALWFAGHDAGARGAAAGGQAATRAPEDRAAQVADGPASPAAEETGSLPAQLQEAQVEFAAPGEAANPPGGLPGKDVGAAGTAAGTPGPRRAPRPPVAAPMRVGYLTADATPWAEVSLNGRVLDRTPFVRYPVPAGRHSLEFRGPDGVVRRQSVTVTAGQTVSVRVDFGAPKELPPQRP